MRERNERNGVRSISIARERFRYLPLSSLEHKSRASERASAPLQHSHQPTGWQSNQRWRMNHDNGTNRVPPTTDDDAAYLAAAYTQAMTGDVTSTSTSTSTSTTTTTAPAESLPSYNLQDDYIDMSEPPITAAPPPPQTSSTTAPPPASHAAPSYGEVPTGSNGSTMPAATAAPPQPPGGLLEAALRDLNNMIPKDTQHAGLTISMYASRLAEPCSLSLSLSLSRVRSHEQC